MRTNSIGTNEEAELIAVQYQNAVKALEQNASDAEAKLKLAEVFIAEGRISGNQGYYTNAALNTLDHALAGPLKKDDRFMALTMKGMVQLTLHQFEDALQTGQTALQINPHNAGVYGVLIDANVELGNYEQAVKMADKMVSIRPDLRSYSRISYLREIHGEMEGAIEAMDMAVKAGFPGQDQTEWCRVQLGNLYERTGQLDYAEMHYRTALEHRENYPWALGALGNLERKKGNNEEAEKLLKSANTFMEDASFHEALALTYQGEKEDSYQESVNQAKSILIGLSEEAHDHQHAHGHSHDHGHSHQVGLEMARLHLEFTGDLDEALKNAKHEYGLRPKNIEVNQVLATVYHLQGNEEKAKEHLNKATITNCQNADLLCLKGLIEGSTETLQKSFEKDPFQNHVLTKTAKEKLNG